MRWRFKSPASWLFTQPFIQAQINENIKAPRRWPLWGEFTGEFPPPQMASNAENVSIWWRLLIAMCYPQSAIESIVVLLCSLAVRGRWYTDIYICATLKLWQLHDLNKPHFEGSWHQYSRCKLMCVSNMTKSSIYVRMVYLNGIYTNDLLVWGDGCYWNPLVIPLGVFKENLWIEICCTCDLIARITLLCKCHLQQWNFSLLYCYVWHWHSINHRIEPQPLILMMWLQRKCIQ